MLSNSSNSSKSVHIVFRVLNFLHSTSSSSYELTPMERLLLINLASHKGVKGIFPSITALSVELKISRRHVIRSLEKLSNRDLIVIKNRSGIHNTYTLNEEKLSTTRDMYVTSANDIQDLTSDMGVTGTSDMYVTRNNKALITNLNLNLADHKAACRMDFVDNYQSEDQEPDQDQKQNRKAVSQNQQRSQDHPYSSLSTIIEQETLKEINSLTTKLLIQKDASDNNSTAKKICTNSPKMFKPSTKEGRACQEKVAKKDKINGNDQNKANSITNDGRDNNQVVNPQLAGLDEFNKLYPQKGQDLHYVKKAWIEQHCYNNPQKVIQSLRHHINVVWKGRAVEYIPYPTTFLNKRRFDDKIMPKPSGQPDVSKMSNSFVPLENFKRTAMPDSLRSFTRSLRA